MSIVYGEYPEQDRLAFLIGLISYQTTMLEHLVHDLSLAAAWVADPNISGDRKARTVLHVALINQKKIGDKIASAKAITHLAIGDCALFTRADLLLTRVGKLAEERNRYLHDAWSVDLGMPGRTNMKTRISKPKGGPVALDIMPHVPIPWNMIEGFVAEQRSTWEALVEVENELAGLARDPA